MSWSINQGPSFNITRPGSSYNQLTGFTQRFMLPQDSQLMTPGKAEPHLAAETMKGTTKLRKGSRKIKNPRCKDLVMPKGQDDPIYGGFSKSMPNKATKKVVRKRKAKLKKRRVK